MADPQVLVITPDIEALLEQADHHDIELLTSAYSVVEVAWAAQEKTQGQLDPTVEDRINALWLPTSPLRLIEFHLRLAEQARTLMRLSVAQGWTLKPGDAIHLATAQAMQVDALHTYENAPSREHWFSLTGLIVSEPPPNPTSTPKLL